MSNSLRILLIVEPRLRKCMVDMLSCSHIFLPEASSKSTNIDRISWSTPSWLSIIFLSCSICVLLSFSISSLRHLAASSSWTVFWSWFLNSSWDWLSLRLWNKWKKKNNINKTHFHPILLQGVKKLIQNLVLHSRLALNSITEPRLALNSQQSFYLNHPSPEIICTEYGTAPSTKNNAREQFLGWGRI